MAVNQEHNFAEFLSEKNIVSGLRAKDWKDAIAQLASLLHKNEDSFDRDAVIAACIAREEAASTVIAPRLALPHARVDDLERLLVAVGTSPDGVDFVAHAQGRVNVIILILTPTSDPGLYLQALAGLTRRLGEPGALGRLIDCKTPRHVCDFFAAKKVELPPYLKAHDVMDRPAATLRESDDLEKVIHLFCSKNLLDLPVVDEEGDVRGTVSLEDLLRLSMPEHLLWMHDLSPILHFEPFADLLRREKESRVADFMREDHITVSPDVPAIQLAKIFLAQQARQILVVEGRRLLGVVNFSAFMAKLFWA